MRLLLVVAKGRLVLVNVGRTARIGFGRHALFVWRAEAQFVRHLALACLGRTAHRNS